MLDQETASSFDHVRKCVTDAFSTGEIHPKLITRPGGRFLERVRNAAAILADNDGTVTSGASWAAVGQYLGDSHAEDERKDREWYYNHAHLEQSADRWADRALKDDSDWAAAEGAWGARTIIRLANAGVTREQIRVAGATLTMRAGVRELLGRHLHRTIITFGIADVVNGFLRAYCLPQTEVTGFQLTYRDNGAVSGHHPGSVVTRACKGKAAQRFLTSRGLRPEQSFSVFDSVVDRRLILPGGTSLLLVPGTEPNRALHRFRDMHVETLWNEGLDAVLVDNGFTGFNKLLNSAS